MRIIRVNPPAETPSWMFDADGKTSFDLNPNTIVAITKQIDGAGGADVGKMKQDTVQSFSIPLTKKNLLLIGNYGNPNAFGFNHFSSIPIQITSGAYVFPEQEIRVKKTGDKEIELDAFGSANQWIKAAANLKLKDIPMGVLPSYNWDWFYDVHANRSAYTDGELPIFPPVANYGKRIREGGVSLEDLRLWFSPLFLLKAGFCEMGYTFTCPIMESESGRRQWIYILSKDFQEKVFLENRVFNAVLSSSTTIPQVAFQDEYGGVLVFDNDSVLPGYDNGDLYDSTSGEFGGAALKADFLANITVTGVVAPISGISSVYIQLFRTKADGSVERVGSEVYSPSTGTTELKFVATDISITESDNITLSVTQIGFPGSVDADSTFYNFPKEAILAEGDTIILSDIIDPSISVLDLLKGMVHLYSLKPNTIAETNEIQFLSEDGGVLSDEDKGVPFFQTNEKAKDWTKKVIPNSLEINIKEIKHKRNMLLSFRTNGNDWGVKNAGFEFPLHGRNIDYGTDYEEGTTKSENPFFAPTINDFDFPIRHEWVGTSFSDTAPYIPFLWKSDRDANGVAPGPMVNIAPRIIMAYPYSRVFVPPYKDNGVDTTGDITIYRDSEPSGTDRMQYYAPCAQIFPSGFQYRRDGAAEREDFRTNCVYGSAEYDSEQKDLYSRFYANSIERLYTAIPLELLIRLTHSDFLNFSPRDKVYIKYNSIRYGDLSFYARIVSITDYTVNRFLATPVLLQPSGHVTPKTCCNCKLKIRKIGGVSPQSLTLSADLYGTCGEVESYDWSFNSLGSNVGAIGERDLKLLIIGSTQGIYIFSVTVTVITSCGTYTAEYSQP